MNSVLGPEVVVIGNISGQADLEIRGRLQGNLRLEGRLLLAKGGTVVGNIEATTVQIAGTIHGDVEARDGIEIQGSGAIEGNMVAPRIGIETGAEVRGMLTTAPQGAKVPEVRTTIERAPREDAQVPDEPVDREIVIPEDSERGDPEFEEEEGDLDEGSSAADESDGPLRARRRRRRRRKKPEAPGQSPGRWSEEVAEPRVGQPLRFAASPEGPPRPPTFQKGTHAQRRRS